MMSNMVLTRPFIDCSYIRVTNIGRFLASFYVEFSYRGERKFLRSNIIRRDSADRICVPVTATNIVFIVDIFRGENVKEIVNINIQDNANHCFIVSRTYDIPLFREIPCGD